MWQRLFFRFGAKRTFHRVKVAVWALSTSEEKALAFDKLDSALGLIEKYAPEKSRTLQVDVRSILVAGLPTFRACYIHKLRMAELYHGYVLDVQTTPESLACSLIHEAQHARLYRLGFGYEEPIRGRIERLCFRAERNFARLLPKGGELVAEAEAWMEADPEPVFSDESRRRGKLKALEELGCPDWIIKELAHQEVRWRWWDSINSKAGFRNRAPRSIAEAACFDRSRFGDHDGTAVRICSDS